MLYLTITIFILGIFIAGHIMFYKDTRAAQKVKRNESARVYEAMKKDDEALASKVSNLEETVAKQFFFYDLIRRLVPILDKKELLSVFFEEIKYLGEMERIESAGLPEKGDYLEFKVADDDHEPLRIKTSSRKVVEYFPYFAKLLSLCVERINLYDKLQQLSIYDSLTDIYNRRYFMFRYAEEFERAKKYNLNVSFLMIDVDNFKKINDTYGHLVGDAVLKDVARVIKDNMREIDFVARFGGEEFSAILLDTDKVGAIMLAERIRERVAVEKIRAFDEVVSVTVSIGIASYPQNALHSDVLMEIADKALYKAKISGKDRAAWF